MLLNPRVRKGGLPSLLFNNDPVVTFFSRQFHIVCYLHFYPSNTVQVRVTLCSVEIYKKSVVELQVVLNIQNDLSGSDRVTASGLLQLPSFFCTLHNTLLDL
jgi:hypothetical protein